MIKSPFWSGVFVGFIFFAVLNTMPFADAEKYRRAIEHCEKTLPRDQHCVVIGVPESWEKQSEKK